MALHSCRSLLGTLPVVLFALTSCELSPLSSGIRDDEDPAACSACHGTSENAAPPFAVRGHDETTSIGVGAHQAHLTASSTRDALPCSSCHIVPLGLLDAGHVDPLPAEVVFDALSAHYGELLPTWDRTLAVCSEVYCHGATLQGGTFTAPRWTQVDGSQVQCDGCHGNPPALPHPQHDDCGKCHSATVLANGAIDVAGGRHLDGEMDVVGEGCDGCHGSDGVSAPPYDMMGNTNTDAVGVGAHRQHIDASDWHRSVECSDCHVVPLELDDPGHVDTDLPAELVWSPLARTGGAQPAWDGERCSSVYCHGATLTGPGSVPQPVWTLLDGSQGPCDACHQVPPPYPHPGDTACEGCHPNAAPGLSFSSPVQHVDGVLDLDDLGCAGCHGDGASPAPPRDVAGNLDVTARGVGAHRLHLMSSDWHAPVLCTDCHLVPSEVYEAGHVDTDLPAELVWSEKATAGGKTSPQFDGVTCSQSYCHGASLAPGGTHTAPEWTEVDTGQVDCGTCHSSPPLGEHPDTDECVLCHADVVDADRAFVDPSLHIDGVVQFGNPHVDGWDDPALHGTAFNDQGPAACTECHGEDLLGGLTSLGCDGCHAEVSDDWTVDCLFCHGGASNTTGAPPEGIDGETDRLDLHVGAHTEHVQSAMFQDAFDCARCHIHPESIFDLGHIDGDGVAEVRFDARNPAGNYDSKGTCAEMYCHGDGANRTGTVEWTEDPITRCSSCHADNTTVSENNMSGPHATHVEDESLNCNACHAGVVSASNDIIAASLHIDGEITVRFLQTGTYNAVNRTCTPACHELESW